MLIWKKSPKLKVRCFTVNQQLVDLFPIVEARKAFPKWIEELPPAIQLNPKHSVETIKVCPGINDFYKRGLCIPLWQEHKLIWDHEKLLEVVTPNARHNENWNSHPPMQYGEGFKNHINVKLMSPWFIETDRVVPFLSIDPVWSRATPLDYSIPPGTLEFKYQHSTNVNMFLPPVPPNEIHEIFLSAGKPLIHLIPLEPVNIELEFLEMTEAEFNKRQNWQWSFDNLYLRTKKLLEK